MRGVVTLLLWFGGADGSVLVGCALLLSLLMITTPIITHSFRVSMSSDWKVGKITDSFRPNTINYPKRRVSIHLFYINVLKIGNFDNFS